MLIRINEQAQPKLSLSRKVSCGLLLQILSYNSYISRGDFDIWHCTYCYVLSHIFWCLILRPKTKQKTTGWSGVHLTTEAHCVKLTLITMWYVCWSTRKQYHSCEADSKASVPQSSHIYNTEENTFCYLISVTSFFLHLCGFLLDAEKGFFSCVLLCVPFSPLNSVLFSFPLQFFFITVPFLSFQVGLERKYVWLATVREATWVWRHRCALLPLVCECQMALWQPTQLPCWPPTPHPPVC